MKTYQYTSPSGVKGPLIELPRDQVFPPLPAPYDGSAKWAELHLKSIKDEITPQWLDAWEQGLPSFGCSCLSHWRAIHLAHPLPPSGQFTWGVDRHNEINAHFEADTGQKRPLFSHDQAFKLWSARQTASPP
jgi:hypothetical protein